MRTLPASSAYLPTCPPAYLPAARLRQASTKPSKSPSNSPVAWKFSGCHCTPTQKRAAGDFGGFDDAVGRRRGHDEAAAERAHGLVMPAVHGADAVGADERGQARARARRRRCARACVGGPRRRAAAARPGSLGMSWISVPPSATFSTCRPRQMASTGRSAASARRTSVDLEGVAAGFGDVVGRVRRLAVERRIDVVAAGQQQPVDAARARRPDRRRRARAAAASAPARRTAAS